MRPEEGSFVGLAIGGGKAEGIGGGGIKGEFPGLGFMPMPALALSGKAPGIGVGGFCQSPAESGIPCC